MIPIDQALELALSLDPGCRRIDYLTSLYEYASRLPKPCRIVEIGCYHGQSTCMMACAIHGTGSELYTIDPLFAKEEVLAPDAEEPKGILYRWGLREFLDVIQQYHLSDVVYFIPEYSHVALSHWKEKPVDLLFVDGEHSVAGVLKDCEWMRVVRSGGYAAFDDWMAAVEHAVQEYIADKPEWKILHESTDTPQDYMCVTLLQKT